jgi:hypothetical protein
VTTPGGIKGCLHRSTSPRSGFGQLTAFLSSRTDGSHVSPSRSEAVYNAPAPLVKASLDSTVASNSLPTAQWQRVLRRRQRGQLRVDRWTNDFL